MIIEMITKYEGESTLSAFEASTLLEVQSEIEEYTGEVVSEEELESLETEAGAIYVANYFVAQGQPQNWIFRKTTKEAYNARVMEEMQAKLLK